MANLPNNTCAQHNTNIAVNSTYLLNTIKSIEIIVNQCSFCGAHIFFLFVYVLDFKLHIVRKFECQIEC